MVRINIPFEDHPDLREIPYLLANGWKIAQCRRKNKKRSRPYTVVEIVLCQNYDDPPEKHRLYRVYGSKLPQTKRIIEIAIIAAYEINRQREIQEQINKS